MKLNSMEDLFIHELKDLYSAEKQLTKALPKMAKGATNEALAQLIRDHLEETQGQLERLETIFAELGKSPRGHTCKAMEGLIEEGAELLKEDGDPAVIDAAIIGACQRVEHYEMAGYGTARTFAEELGYDEAAELLQQTLDEEKSADVKLTELAVTVINDQAEDADDEEEDAEEEEEAEVE